MPQLYALPDERDVIVTHDAVLDAALDGGRALTGEEIGVLADQIDWARLETLWREAHQAYPLGSWVRGPGDVHGSVATHHRGTSGTQGHSLLVRAQDGTEHTVPVAEARPIAPPQGAA